MPEVLLHDPKHFSILFHFGLCLRYILSYLRHVHGNFENKTATRNSNIETAVTTFNSGEWSSTATTNYENASPGTHTCDYPAGSPDPEPTNHASSFSVSANGYNQIDLTWSDNDGDQAYFEMH